MSDVNKRLEQMQERLDEVQEEIDEARAEAEELDRQHPEEAPIARSKKPSETGDAAGEQSR